jgi:hypothetical protein
MKTTIEISDAPLAAAKRAAAEHDTTLRTILDAALSGHDRGRGTGKLACPALHLSRPRFATGISESDWSRLRERAYEGRGG